VYDVSSKKQTGELRMNLKVYLATINMTEKDFSNLISYNRCYISLIANGRVKPGKKLARIIERATQGKVKL